MLTLVMSMSGSAPSGNAPQSAHSPGALEQKPSTVADSFGFKGDNIGETLGEFKARARHDVWDDWHKIQVHYPLCTGDKLVDPQYNFSIMPSGIDELYINAKDTNRYVFCAPDPATTMAGVSTGELRYHFVDGKLFEITTHVDRADFPTVERGFIEKYGSPNASEIEHFQNGYGATFQGKADVWTRGTSVIEIHEISESHNNQSTVDIYDRPAFEEYYGIKHVAHPGKDM